jgi:hypothetical protein
MAKQSKCFCIICSGEWPKGISTEEMDALLETVGLERLPIFRGNSKWGKPIILKDVLDIA